MRVPLIISVEGEDKKFSVPTSWSDMTAREAFRYLDWLENTPENIMRMYEIMTGLDEETISKCKNMDVVNLIDRNLSFIWSEKAPFGKKKIPEYIVYKESMVKVPGDIWFKEFGQFIFFENEHKNIISDDIPKLEKTIRSSCLVCAVYMYQELTREKNFDSDKVGRIAKEFEKMPAVEVLPISIFFWKRYRKLRNGGRTIFPRRPLFKRKMQAFKDWIGSVILPRSTHLPQAT